MSKAGDTVRRALNSRLWMLYRITLKEREAIEKYERAHPSFKYLLGQRLGTDHNHKTGQIRGLLEWRINRAYGMLEAVCPDNLPRLLHALAEFHEKPPAVAVLGEKRYGLIGKAKKKKKMIYGPPIEEATSAKQTAKKR